jgi:hypothetical protein
VSAARAQSAGGPFKQETQLALEARARDVGVSIHVFTTGLSMPQAVERAHALAPVIAEIRATGASSLREIAAGLNARGIPTAQGGAWSAMRFACRVDRFQWHRG